MNVYLQPHSQPAPAWPYSAWCACTGKWLGGESEAEWDTRRTTELVRCAVSFSYNIRHVSNWRLFSLRSQLSEPTLMNGEGKNVDQPCGQLEMYSYRWLSLDFVRLILSHRIVCNEVPQDQKPLQRAARWINTHWVSTTALQYELCFGSGEKVILAVWRRK